MRRAGTRAIATYLQLGRQRHHLVEVLIGLRQRGPLGRDVPVVEAVRAVVDG